MVRLLALAVLVAPVLSAPGLAQEETSERPSIEVAILLDTSGSMSGLIHQARTQLWAIVNELALAEKDGVAPDLRVALYEYGKDTLSEAEGWIRQIVALTGDLDKVSEELFALETSGGDEYCGQVIARAVEELEWSEGDHYRAIFIAGNEPFTQGGVSPDDACRKAIEKGIMVNTIHCGSEAEGREGQWDRGATIADGQFLNIDHNQATAAIPAPQDERIAELGQKINDTYVVYGSTGKAGLQLQAAQDENARNSGVLVDRIVTKGNNFYGNCYMNGAWDLCDALREKAVDLSKIEDEDLPEEMRGMSLEEREAFVEAKASERKAIQEEILKLAAERDAFLAAEREKLAEEAGTLESAANETVRRQMEAKSYRFRR